MKPTLTTLFILTGLMMFGQNEYDIWNFGSGHTLNFTSGTPVYQAGSPIATTEGSASISNSAGVLQFYTDGVSVWDRNNAAMPNGTGLLGHASSTQSAIIVPKPLSTNIYYIFTCDADAGLNGIRWTEVDMNLNAGFGAVTVNKNIVLRNQSCEKLTAVRHCNNRDVWVVSHDWNTFSFRTWLVSPTGINPTPVVSFTGFTPSGTAQSGYGQLKANTRGDKLAAAWYGTNARVEIYDFDKITGNVYNAVNLGALTGAYGVEFSKSGRMLYASTNGGGLWQWDLCAASVTGSKYSVAVMGAFGGSLQLAPDNRIYIARGTNAWLARINNPEIYGGGCGFQDNAIILPAASRFGLPNFCPFYAIQGQAMFTLTSNCGYYCFISSPQLVTCSSNVLTSFKWTFPDGVVMWGSTVCRQFTTNWNNPIRLEVLRPCDNDTTIQTVTITTGISTSLTIN